MNYLVYVVLVTVALYFDNRIIYVLYTYIIAKEFIKQKKISKNFLLSAALYSIVLPDNYSTAFVFLTYFIGTIVLDKSVKVKKSKYNLLLGCIIFLGLFSTLVNSVPIVNVLFALLSLLPLFVFLCLLQRTEKAYFKNLHQYIGDIFFIEVLATIVNFVLYRGIGSDDWSCGTFSRSGGQQAQLFIIAAYLLLFYLVRYRQNKNDKKLLGNAVASGVVLLSTNCWALLLMFIIGIIVSFILALNRKKISLLLLLLIILPVAARAVYPILPDKIIVVTNKIVTDKEYFNYRFHKATVYKETFVEIPSQDFKFLLIGNGLGYYSSRGALICTGEYTNFYNKLFKPSISKYTDEYIMDYLVLANNNGGSDYGSVLARPYSSIIALMGECGYLGCILFLLLIISMLKGKHIGIKSLIIIWLSFCFMENYFEYSKVLLMLYACILSMQEPENLILFGRRFNICYEKEV